MTRLPSSDARSSPRPRIPGRIVGRLPKRSCWRTASTVEALAELVAVGLATKHSQHVMAGRCAIEVTRIRITDVAGERLRKADAPLRQTDRT